jgi:hypothetical protein
LESFKIPEVVGLTFSAFRLHNKSQITSAHMHGGISARFRTFLAFFLEIFDFVLH